MVNWQHPLPSVILNYDGTSVSLVNPLPVIGGTSVVTINNGTVIIGSGTSFVIGTGTAVISDKKISTVTTAGVVYVRDGATTILPNLPTRNCFILVNDAGQPIYIRYGGDAINPNGTAIMNSGIRLNASGGMLVDTIYTGVVMGICNTATIGGNGTLTVTAF